MVRWQHLSSWLGIYIELVVLCRGWHNTLVHYSPSRRHFNVETLFCALSSRIEPLNTLLLQNSDRVRCVSVRCIVSIWLGQPSYFLCLSFRSHFSITNLTKFGNQGVIYSRHKCFISILEIWKLCIHSSKNSRVNRVSLVANVSLTDFIKIVLLDGIHNPATIISDVSKSNAK